MTSINAQRSGSMMASWQDAGLTQTFAEAETLAFEETVALRRTAPRLGAGRANSSPAH